MLCYLLAPFIASASDRAPWHTILPELQIFAIMFGFRIFIIIFPWSLKSGRSANIYFKPRFSYSHFNCISKPFINDVFCTERDIPKIEMRSTAVVADNVWNRNWRLLFHKVFRLLAEGNFFWIFFYFLNFLFHLFMNLIEMRLNWNFVRNWL